MPKAMKLGGRQGYESRKQGLGVGGLQAWGVRLLRAAIRAHGMSFGGAVQGVALFTSQGSWAYQGGVAVLA